MSTNSPCTGPVLAHVLGSYERQPLECGSASMRIRGVADVLGAGGHGSVHAPHHRIWNSSRNRRWSGALPHVQSSDWRPEGSEILKFRPRSVVSVSSVASQSKGAWVTEIKTVPYVPLSHPFVERLIGTIRRECLDQLLFWTAADLEAKLLAFKTYYNGYRVHGSLEGQTPIKTPESKRRQFQMLSLAQTLSRFISNTNGCMSTNSPCTGCRSNKPDTSARPDVMQVT